MNGVTNLRSIFKRECNKMGVKRHWVLDGIGAVTGVPLGQSDGSNCEMLPEIQNVMACDGVHLKPEGYKNLAKNISEALTGLKQGKLGSSLPDPVSGNGPQQALRKKDEYFWRGFSSPVGDFIGQAVTKSYQHSGARGRGDYQRGGHHHGNHHGRAFHPYRRKY
jgi:hypothetical protein